MQLWHTLDILPANCHLNVYKPGALVIALAGRFTLQGSVETIAERLGAISETRGLVYWSVSSHDWQVLISAATAVVGPEAHDSRGDFRADEVLNGRSLYFTQNDTRSWGTNLIRFQTLESSPDHLQVESENESAIGLGPITLFAAHTLHTVHFLTRTSPDQWSYYGLTTIENGLNKRYEKSLINRQNAFYRFMSNQQLDKEPPLAP